MKLGAFKDALRKAPELKAKEWKKPLPEDSINCPVCGGSGKEEMSIQPCVDCNGSGLKLSGAPKPKKKIKTIAEDVSATLKAMERRDHTMILLKGKRAEMLGPIKGRSTTMLIIDDPIMERAAADDAVDALHAAHESGGLLGAIERSRGKDPTDFLEDIFDALSTPRTETIACPWCGQDVRPGNPEDHANDCTQVRMKKCVECKGRMGLDFKRKTVWKYKCKACIRKKFEGERKWAR